MALVTLITTGMKLYSPNMHRAKAVNSSAAKQDDKLLLRHTTMILNSADILQMLQNYAFLSPKREGNVHVRKAWKIALYCKNYCTYMRKFSFIPT